MRSIVTAILFISIATATAAGHRHRPSSAFIRASCHYTRYPALCESSLSGYAAAVRHSPRQLAHAALSVSVTSALAASSFVSRLSSPSSKSPRSRSSPVAVRDCRETLADSVDRLRRSVKELNRLGRYGSVQFGWHLSNVQTWVSAAITDLSTCLDSLKEDGKSVNVRGEIRDRIQVVAQVTSNALALVNRLQRRK